MRADETVADCVVTYLELRRTTYMLTNGVVVVDDTLVGPTKQFGVPKLPVRTSKFFCNQVVELFSSHMTDMMPIRSEREEFS